MSNYRNALLAGLAAACVLLLCISLAARLPTLVALAIGLVGGGAVFAAVSARRPVLPDNPMPTIVSTPLPPPVQFQSLPVTGIRLPSSLADYTFVFAANVRWLNTTDGTTGGGEVAVNEVIRRAREITEQRDPGQATLIAPALAVALTALQPDPDGKVQVKAESVQLHLPPEDQQRLDELATLRKQEDLWDYQRRYQESQRRYLRTDVLKDSGSAVVWWLAKHEDQPEKVADSIDVLTRLARAANNADGVEPSAPAVPRTAAGHFDAFLDALDLPPRGDERLTLTSQVARLVDGHDQKTADEMRRRYSEVDGSEITGDYSDYLGEAADMQPE